MTEEEAVRLDYGTYGKYVTSLHISARLTRIRDSAEGGAKLVRCSDLLPRTGTLPKKR